MTHLTLRHPIGDAQAIVALHGGQTISWRVHGRERLFLSPLSSNRPGAAIRGGIPVIFPQFAERGPGLRHGFARLLQWEVVQCDPDRAVLVLRDDNQSRQWWPKRFALQIEVGLLPGGLTSTLRVENTDEVAFDFSAALHTYLAVRDVATATVGGLQGRAYLDSSTGLEGEQSEARLDFRGEVDRIYLGTHSALELESGRGTIRTTAHGFADTVIWNPGESLAAGIADLGSPNHRGFVCVEAAQIAPVRIEPGQTWSGAQTLTLSPG